MHSIPGPTEINSNHSHLTSPDANSVVHYLMINYPSTITKNLLLIPQVSNHSTFQPFSLHLNSCTVSMEVGDLPFWALLHTFHCASFWLTTIIPLSSHTQQSFLLSLRPLWLPVFIRYSFSHILFLCKRPFPIHVLSAFQV